MQVVIRKQQQGTRRGVSVGRSPGRSWHIKTLTSNSSYVDSV